MQGWIKDYRKELESDIWLMPPLYHRTWQWLKYKVNHMDREIPMRDGSRMLIKRGQHLTSIREIAHGIGYYEGRKWREPNPKTVSSILEWMVKAGMISIERGRGNRQYTLITLINHDVYQGDDDWGNSKATVDGEARKQSMDINKNDERMIENEKNKRNPLTRNESKSYIHRDTFEHKKNDHLAMSDWLDDPINIADDPYEL